MTTPAAAIKPPATPEDLIAEMSTPGPVVAPAAPVEAPEDEHTPHDEELASHFANLDEELDGEAPKTPPPVVEPPKDAPAPASVQQPPAPAAPPSAPAQAPANMSEPVQLAPQPAELPKSVPQQPESPGVLPPELDLFGDMAQPPSQPAPVQQSQAEQPPMAPAPQQPAPTTQPLLPEEQVRAAQQNDYAKLREGYITQLEEVYKLDEATARDLVVEPEKVVPKLFARMHADMVAAVAQGVIQQVPQMIELATRQAHARQNFNRAFYTAWPQLGKREYVPNVQNTLRAYRQLNPTASMEQTIQEVGAMVSVQLRVAPPGMMQVAPAAPIVPPISPNTAPRAAPTGPAKDEWGKLNEDWDHEDI